MENLTLGEISKTLAFIVALIGSIVYLKKAIINALNKLLQPIKKEIKEVKEETAKNNLSSIKTDLINLMELADKKTISTEQKLICYELYDDYCQHGGNSYVHDHWEKLKKEGKI